MNIVCCCALNDSYFDGFRTFFYSLVKHNPWFNYDLNIYIWGSLSEENRCKIQQMYRKVEFIEIDARRYQDVKSVARWRSWNLNCISRFEIFGPSTYDKLVFFDVDMLVLGDISYIFNVDVEFGGVEIVSGAEMDHPGRYDVTKRSFNGGVLVISSKYLNNETKNSLIELGLKKPWTGDEPVLNTFFTNEKVTFLPQIYNVQTPQLTEENFKDARIIHFLSDRKPWMKGTLQNRYDEFVIKSINNTTLLIKLDTVYRKYYKDAYEHYEQ